METLLLLGLGYVLGVVSLVLYQRRPRKPVPGSPDAALRLYQEMKEKRLHG